MKKIIFSIGFLMAFITSCITSRQDYKESKFYYVHTHHHIFTADTVNYESNGCVYFHDAEYNKWIRTCGDYTVEEPKKY